MTKKPTNARGSADGKGQRSRKRTLTIEEKLQALAREIPRSEWKKIPRDLSANHDYYLYGMPKRF